mmetsp:Transcript_10979/g.22417  ORF Transcript_10979/g.22417 Transcript_10979/m.22417 type:complete len:88 (+) Transcript_10979:744-1007(+)
MRPVNSLVAPSILPPAPFLPTDPERSADVMAAVRSDWMSLADPSLHAKRRRSVVERGKDGTNRPLRESHANRNKMQGGFDSAGELEK